MSQTYELWRDNDSCTLIEGQYPQRGLVMNEPGATLMLVFKAETREEAIELKDRFCYGGNPDGFESLELPTSRFLITERTDN